MRHRRSPADPQKRLLVLDSGALTALAARRDRARAALESALAREAAVAVPAVVLAESTTGNGPRDAAVNRVLAALGAAVLPADETTARRAGALRYRVRSEATIDALVVAAAAGANADAVLLTGERRADHLRRLASGLPSVRVEAV